MGCDFLSQAHGRQCQSIPRLLWLRCGLSVLPKAVRFKHPLPNRHSEHERCIPFATQGLECEGKDSPASLAQVVRMHKGEMSTWLDTALYSPVLQFFLLGFPIALPVQLPLPPLQALSHGSKILTHQVMRDFWPQAPLCVFNCIKRCLTKDLQKKARRQPKG